MSDSASVAIEGLSPKVQMPEMTMWSTVSNLTGHGDLVNTKDDPLWYVIDLTSTDFSSSRLVAFPTGGAFISLSVGSSSPCADEPFGPAARWSSGDRGPEIPVDVGRHPLG